MRKDFLLSEVLCEGCISNEQTDRLLKIVNLCISGKGSLTLVTHADVDAAWERASLWLTPMSFGTRFRWKAKVHVHVV